MPTDHDAARVLRPPAAPATPSVQRLLASVVPAAALVPVASTMVAVALPEILADLALGGSAIWWLVTGYLVLVAVLQVPAGRLADWLGQRRMLIGGTLLLALAAIAAAMATGPVMLVTARLLQGAAGAALVPSGLALLRRAVPDDERDRAVGTFTATLAGGGVVGVAMGGLLVAIGGWRTAFGAVGVAALGALVPLVRAASIQGRNDDAMANKDERVTRVAGAPQWGRPAARIALASLAFHVVLLSVPLRLTSVGYSSATSGVVVGVFALGSAGGAMVAAPLTARLGARRTVELVVAMSAVTLGALAVVPITPAWLVGFLGVAGCGLGSLLGGGFARGLGRAAPEGAGSVAGRLSLARYAGSIAGTAALPPLLATTGTSGGLLLAAGAALLMVAARPAAVLRKAL